MGDENGKKLARWDRVTNCYPINCELAENVRSVASNWNICVANWLKLYVYSRVANFGPLMATIFTYTMSAFWHGFYPGYYVFFLYAGIFTMLGRFARRTFRPWFVSGPRGAEKHSALKPLYDVAG